MADGYLTATMAGLIAALLADPAVTDLVGDRVVDEPGEGIGFPYIRPDRLELVNEDTDGTEGALVQVGLAVHSRPGRSGGRVEAARICERINSALHRSETLICDGFTVVDVEVQTWAVDRARDGKSYEGRVALTVRLSA
ncbi:DUF3168 domain-containing protein [Rhodobacteraceae bacterium R_SAG7]|nr:DUF3168 domain-containing protein [Rhodobacteraceae bacterium R_SAG7]